MGEMRDSDWSRENLLRSDWLVLEGATITTIRACCLQFFFPTTQLTITASAYQRIVTHFGLSKGSYSQNF